MGGWGVRLWVLEVCLWVQGSVHTPLDRPHTLPLDTPPHPGHPPQSTSGRYTSYWNALLLYVSYLPFNVWTWLVQWVWSNSWSYSLYKWFKNISGNTGSFMTRMHSSGMRTARLLAVSPSMHCSGWGVPGTGGCTWSRGVYLVPGTWWTWSRGWCTWSRGVPAQVPPREQNDRQV